MTIFVADQIVIGKRRWQTLLCLIVSSVMQACAVPAAAGHCKVDVSLRALGKVNLDPKGKSLPTTLRFLQLKDVEQLRKARFEDVWQHPAAALGEDLLDSKEVSVFPNETRTETLSIKEETVYLATVALFLDPTDSVWKTWDKLPPAQTADRCEDKKSGGPWYVQLENQTVQSGPRPLPVLPAKKDK